MADLSQAYSALKNADAAGDHEAATKIATYIKQQESAASASSVPDSPEAKTLAGSAKDVAVSTGVGGVIGAAAPEILEVAGRGIAAVGDSGIPATRPLKALGMGMQAAGVGMRSMRLAEAGAGALSGLVSETSGQIAELAGASKGGATATRLATGMLSPGASAIAGYVSKTAKTAWNVVNRIAGNEVSNVPKAVEAAKERLSSAAVAGQPQLALHEVLANGVAHDLQAADTAAKQTIAEAHKRAASIAETDSVAAQRVIDEARVRGDALKSEAAKRARVLNDATDNRLQTAAKVHASASKELESVVAKPREVSDIGNELRSKVTAEQQQAIMQRSAEYQAKQTERDAAVAIKEQNGLTVDSVPAMKDLKKEIETKLLLTKQGREAAGGKAQVTEQGVAQGYQRVYDAISNRRVQTGVDENGNAQYQTFKTTFEALDHVRRKLGDAGFGKDVEGYAGIGANVAKDLYSKISKIQEEFAGPAQKELQEGYSEASKGMAKFGSSGGKKLTAVDRLDPEVFMKDPAAVPGSFFKTQQGVKDLVELTGDKTLVANAAQSFTARQLDGKSAAQVAKWGKDNSDWIREVPGLQQKVTEYAQKVQRIEATGGRVEASAAKMGKEAETVKPKAAVEADRMMEDARKEASARVGSRVDERQTIVKEATASATEARKAVEAKAQAVIKSGFPAEATKKLLASGTPEELATASRYLAGAPGGKAALEGSVRGVLRDMGEKEIATTYRDRIVPMLREGKVLKPEALAKLDQDVAAVLKAYKGPEQRSAVRKIVMAALTATGGSIGARVVAGVTGRE